MGSGYARLVATMHPLCTKANIHFLRADSGFCQSMTILQILNNGEHIHSWVRSVAKCEYLPASHSICPLERKSRSSLCSLIIKRSHVTDHVTLLSPESIHQSLNRHPPGRNLLSPTSMVVVPAVDVSRQTKVSHLDHIVAINPVGEDVTS